MLSGSEESYDCYEAQKTAVRLAIPGTMQMCICLQERVRGHLTHRQRHFISAALQLIGLGAHAQKK